MSKPIRVWATRALGAAAVALAGLFGGWVFRPVTPDEPNEPAVPAPEQSISIGEDKPVGKENHLAKESSPYLQLHKYNPIDWYPWGSEALEKAKREDKLIFLSIGYSSCFWCHVMERESFNDAEIARILNESFVCIKVDREELLDVDEIFMTFVQMSNQGGGGWPLTVFLTPDAKPIAGTTYLPPRDARGMPGLFETLGKVLDRWATNRADLEEQAEDYTRTLQSMNRQRAFSLRELDRRIVNEAIEELAGEFDPQFGGFGYDPRNPRRPKFPQPSILSLLAYESAQSDDGQAAEMLVRSLHHMAQGGIWDCVGGGFHRYSVDRLWRVPHFEKMLYDNAQLARVYLEAFALTKDRVFRHMALRIFQFVEREMTSNEGVFYSALDAESEHEEGKYYVWTKEEVQRILDPQEFSVVSAVQMSGPPNFSEDRYVLQLGDSLPSIAQRTGIHEGNLAGVLEHSAAKLLAARNLRKRPLLDTKVQTNCNGLMIAALADAHRILGDEVYRTAAERAANLILTKLRTADGRLFHVYAGGSAKIPGYLEDYAFLLDGLVALHRATHDEKWLDAARSTADKMHELFWDEAAGGYFQVPKDSQPVLTRLKPAEDTSIPSGNSAAALALVRLAQSSGEAMYAKRSADTLAAFAGPLARSPARWAHMTHALGEYLDAGFPKDSLVVRAGTEEPKVVVAQAVIQQKKVAAGSDFKFDVVFEIDRTWHIYANPASSLEYFPTTLDVTSELGLKDLSIQYPRSRTYQPEGTNESVAVYSESGRIRVSAKLDWDAPVGPAELQLALRYQACNDRRCLAPKAIQITMSIEVVAAQQSPQRANP